MTKPLRPKPTAADHIRVFIVTLVLAAAFTFVLGAAMLDIR